MELKQLRYFQAVARCGNVTKASRELYITQPNLSKSIARLEEELEVPLFEHRQGLIELNDYGRLFLSSVDMALDELNSGVQNIRRMYEVDQNVLSLASNISAYLPDVLPGFFAAHPDIGIRQVDCSTVQMTEHLLNRTVTLGISYEEIRHEQLAFEKLGEKRYMLAINEANPLAAHDKVSVKNLKEEVFICDTSRMSREKLTALCKTYGFTPHINFEIQSNDLLYELVENGHGVCILPLGMGCHILRKHSDNHLKLVDLDDELAPVIIGFAYHKAFRFNKAATTFRDYILQELKKEEDIIREMGYA